jgi:hypothetical protein
MQESIPNGWALIHPRVMCSDELNTTQKLLWGRIFSLSDAEGYCWASNGYLAKEIGISKDTARQHIYKLKKKGYLRIVHDSNEKKSRKIFPIISEGGVEIPTGVGVEIPTQSMLPSETDDTPFSNLTEKKEVFDFWVEEVKKVTGKDEYRPRFVPSSKRMGNVGGRLSEGYTVEEIKMGILGCLGNPRNVEGGYIDLELICRMNKLAQYIAWHKNSYVFPEDRKTPSAPSQELEEFVW